MSRVTGNYAYIRFHDGTELFGTNAFPFRRNRIDVIAYDVDGDRRVVSTEEAEIRVFDPQLDARLPTIAVWQQANHDEGVRGAVKERCEL